MAGTPKLIPNVKFLFRFGSAFILLGLLLLGPLDQLGFSLYPSSPNPAFEKSSLDFEANEGQTDPSVRFLARGKGYSLYLTPTQAVWVIQKPRIRRGRFQKEARKKPEVLWMRLKGANPLCQARGLGEETGKSNYLTGRDPSRWKTAIPQYARVKFTDIYPRIDLVYYGGENGLEYDFVVRPGGNPKDIRLSFQGETQSRKAAGGLSFILDKSQLNLQLPEVYQRTPGGKVSVPGRLVQQGKGEVGFEVENYDSREPLVIDPTLALVYSTFVGGGTAGQNNEFKAMALDPANNVYLLEGLGPGFPTTPGAYQPNAKVPVGGDDNVLVVKMNPMGTTKVYATYVGGTIEDYGTGFFVDSSGNAYVTGDTDSSDFPVTPGAYQGALAGVQNAFAFKLNSTGTALIYSTYFGGNNTDYAGGIAPDGSGNTYLGGYTTSTAFPTTAGAFQTALKGNVNGYAAKLNATGTALLYSTYLGGSGNDNVYALALNSSGNAYLVGVTDSADFPTTGGVFQPVLKGGENAFVTEVNAGGTGLVYSTYLGGNSGDIGFAISVDAAGNAYVTGDTGSTNFPVTPGAFQNALGGATAQNAFVTKLNPTATGLIYSTYLGGNDFDFGQSVTMDALGDAYVGGQTRSTNFPVTPGCLQPALGGIGNTFLTILNPAGSAQIYSSYWGGDQLEDDGSDVALDSSGAIYMAGSTYSTNFPITAGVYQTALSSALEDMWISKFVILGTPTFTPTATFTSTPSPTITATFTATSTFTSTPTATPTFTPTVTGTPTPTPTITRTFTLTVTPTVTPTSTPPCQMHVWPDPYNPNVAVGRSLKFSCVPSGAQVLIYTLAGEWVGQAQVTGDLGEWDGKNRSGVPVSSGIYFFVVKKGSQVVSEGKFLIQNGE